MVNSEQAGACLFRQVVSHLDVNLVGRRTFRPCPTFVNHLDEFLGDVHAPFVAPAVLEPLFELGGGVVVENVHVKFALVGQTCEREIAGAKKSGDRIIGVGAVTEVKLGVKRVAEEKFDDNLARLELSREATKAGFVVIGGRAEGELRAKFLRETPLQANDGLLADLVFLRQEAVGEAQLVLGEPLHANKETTLRPRRPPTSR